MDKIASRRERVAEFKNQLDHLDPNSDRTRWIEVLKGILQDESEVKMTVKGHFGILPRERLTRVLDSFMIH